MLHGFRMSYEGGIHMYDRNSVASFQNVFLNRSMNGIRMYDRYLITGATGFLGRAVSQKLASCSIPVRALVLPNDPYAEQLPKRVQRVTGDVLDKESLEAFFDGSGIHTCVIHCAGIVSVASNPDPIIYTVNVEGTNNIICKCREHNVGRLIYVSSVHVMPDIPKDHVITEGWYFSSDLVDGAYAKSKAIATNLVFDAARHGLNACVVFPSGIIGPGDFQGGSFTAMAKAFLKGKLPFAVRGGYDFVDVRDVAGGILGCAMSGKSGEGYILSGRYITIKEMLDIIGKAAGLHRRPLCLPLGLAKLAAPYYEKRCIRKKKPLFFTPYSIAVLGSNGYFSHKKASGVLSYKPRPIEETLRDMTEWLRQQEES